MVRFTFSLTAGELSYCRSQISSPNGFGIQRASSTRTFLCTRLCLMLRRVVSALAESGRWKKHFQGTQAWSGCPRSSTKGQNSGHGKKVRFRQVSSTYIFIDWTQTIFTFPRLQPLTTLNTKHCTSTRTISLDFQPANCAGTQPPCVHRARFVRPIGTSGSVFKPENTRNATPAFSQYRTNFTVRPHSLSKTDSMALTIGCQPFSASCCYSRLTLRFTTLKKHSIGC